MGIHEPTRLTPAEAERQLEQAFLRHKQGDLDYACGVYMHVLAQYPQQPTALHYLGLIAQQTGKSQEAVRLLERSIALQPRDVRAHNHLGQVWLVLKRPDAARSCFEAAVQIDPNHVDSLNNLANMVRSGGDLERAIAIYRRVLALDPRAALAIYNLANALKDARAYDEALALFERAIEADPNHHQAHHNLGVLLEQKGDFPGAIDHYQAARKLQPRRVKALANLIAIRSYEPDAQTVQDAEARLAAGDVGEDDRVKLHHGLGKHYDRAGNYDAAFRNFAAAKAILRNKSDAFDAGALAAHVGRIIETFSESYFQSVASGGIASDRPVFIVGMPRSGTTLTEQILASHPAIFGAGELQDIPAICRGMGARYPASIVGLDAVAREELAGKYLDALDKRAPPEASRVTDKLPVNFMHLGLIATLLPGARVVHCRRDPMDVGLSCFIELFKMKRDFTTDLESFGEYFLQYARLMAHWRRVLPLRMHELQYEDLVANQEARSRELISFCGLEWDQACLSFEKADRAVLTPSRWQVRQPIYQGSVGRWRNYQAQMASLQQLLQKRGYAYS